IITLVESKDNLSPNVFLSFKNGCAYNEFGQNYFKQFLNENYKVLEFGNYETILGCIKIGMGKSILPLSIIKKLNYEKDLHITKLSKDVANLPTCMICRVDNLPKIKEYLEDYQF
ncbi:LysR family transcriptional regulator, partial [Aliarcobacter butzleri]|nr:LysR family transcriptional regulator [Aliarcobacter butzleri]